MPSRKKAYDMAASGTDSDDGHRSLREAMKSKRRSLLSVFTKSSPNSGRVSPNQSFHSNAASETPSILNETSSNIKQLPQDTEVTISSLTDIYPNPTVNSTSNGPSASNGAIKTASVESTVSLHLIQSESVNTTAGDQITLKSKGSDLDLNSSVTTENRDGNRNSSSVTDKQTRPHSEHVQTQQGTPKSNESYLPSNSATNTSITDISNVLHTDTKMQHSSELLTVDNSLVNSHSAVSDDTVISKSADIITSPPKVENDSFVDNSQADTLTGNSVDETTTSSTTSLQRLYTKSENATAKRDSAARVDAKTSLKQSNSFKAEIKQLLESRYNSLEKSKSKANTPLENGTGRLYKSTSNLTLNTSSLVPAEDRQTKIYATTEKTSSVATIRQISGSDSTSSIVKRSSSTSAIRSTTKNPELSEITGTGTVERLAKNLFKDKQLTGGLMPSLPTSSVPKASSDEENILSPLSTLSPSSPLSPVENKRYTYLVEGIDIPATETHNAEDGINAALDALDSATSEVSGTQKLKKTEEKGFTYLLDKALAAEIKKRAGEAEETRRAKEEEEKLKSQTEINETDNEAEVVIDDLNVNNLKSVFEGPQNTLNSSKKANSSSRDATGSSINPVDKLGRPNAEIHAPFVEAKNRYLEELKRKQNRQQSPRQLIGGAEDMATHGTRKTLIISHEQLGVSRESKSIRNRSETQKAPEQQPEVSMEKMPDPNNNNNAHYDSGTGNVAASFSETSPRSDFHSVNDEGQGSRRSTMFMQIGKQAQIQLSPANSVLGAHTDNNSDLTFGVHSVNMDNDYQMRGEKPQARVIPLQPSLGTTASHPSIITDTYLASEPAKQSQMSSPGRYKSEMVTTLQSSHIQQTSPSMISTDIKRNVSSSFPGQVPASSTSVKRNFEVSANPDKNYKMVISSSAFKGIGKENVALSTHEYINGGMKDVGDRDVEIMDAYPQVVRFDGNKYSTVHATDVYRAQLKDLNDFPVQADTVHNVMRVDGTYSRPPGDAGGAGRAYNGPQLPPSSLSSPRDQARPVSQQIAQTQKHDSGYLVTLKLNNAGITTNVRASELYATANENYAKTHDTTNSYSPQLYQVNNVSAAPYLTDTRTVEGNLSKFHGDYVPAERDDHYTEVKRFEHGNIPFYQVNRMTSTQKPTPPNDYTIHTNNRADQIPSGHISSATMSVHKSFIHNNNQPEESDQNAYNFNTYKQDTRTLNSELPAMHVSKVFHKTEDLEIPNNNAESQRSSAHIRSSQMKYLSNEDLGSYIQDEVDEIDNAQEEVIDPDDTACDIVRGSFLIKNAIDTTSAPKTLDVVEPDDEELVVDDNVNLFHTRYLTNRENPLYDSNPDLSKIDDFIADSKPEFVQQQTITQNHLLSADNGVPSFIVPENSYTQYSQPHRTNGTTEYVTRIDTGDTCPEFVTHRTTDETDNAYPIPRYSTREDGIDNAYPIPRYSSREESYLRGPPPGRDRGVYSNYSSTTIPNHSTRYQYGQGNVGNSRRGPNRAGQYKTMLTTTETSMPPDPTSSSWHYRSEYGHNGRRPWENSAQSVAGSINTEMEMKMGKGLFRTKHPPDEIFSDEEEEEHFEEWEETHTNAFPQNMDKRDITRKQLDELLGKNLNNAIKQSINVDREDEEMTGDMLLEHADGTATTTNDLLNFDTITENVILGINDGTAEVQITVRCERIVPMIFDDLYRKTSIIVTRNIEIDLEATEERKRLYKNILRGIDKPMISDKPENNWGFKNKSSGEDKTLTMRETFKVYKQLMGIADVDDPVAKHDNLMTETRMEEDPVYGDLPLSIKKPDDDAVSFLSAATNTSDILF